MSYDIDMIKVVVKAPSQDPYITEIENTLEDFQRIVGGYIERVELGGYDLFCNEEGKLHSLPPNLRIPGDIVVGQIVVSKSDAEGEQVSLTDEDCTVIVEQLKEMAV